MSAVDCVCKKISLKVLQDSLRPLRFPVNKGFPASLTHAQTLPLAVLIGSFSAIVLSPGETYLWHEESNTVITDILLWGGTPWLRAKRSLTQVPALKDAYQPMEVDETPPEWQGVNMLSATVDLTSEEKRRQHVLRGHYPYDPHCLECQE